MHLKFFIQLKLNCKIYEIKFFFHFYLVIADVFPFVGRIASESRAHVEDHLRVRSRIIWCRSVHRKTSGIAVVGGSDFYLQKDRTFQSYWETA